MLARLDRYRLNRALLGEVANFCLTLLEDRAEELSGGKGDKRKKARDHYQISMPVLESVGRLSAEGGGDDARKGIGLNHPFTEEERSFLEAAVTTFIRRAAEKAADPKGCLCLIGKNDLPKLPK